jgi:sulfocyanin SoxE-like protein
LKLPITRTAGQTDVSFRRYPGIALFALLVTANSDGLRAQASSPSWMSVDTAAHAVSLKLDVTAPAGSPSPLIGGYRDGGVQIVVPRGWTVAWQWESQDSTAPHSLVLMAEREKIPTEGGRPAIDNAMTKAVTTGLEAGSRDVTSFAAEQVGWYWLLCGVPGHAIRGEWIGFKVDAEAQVPAVVEKR